MGKNLGNDTVASSSIYQLHIALEDIAPLIWRRLWVPSDLSLAKLNRVLQTTMGWENTHLHEFQIGPHRYGPVNKPWGADANLIDERRLDIGALLTADVSAFTYLYDFGNNWRHIVVIEERLPPDECNEWIQCIAGANACPPEDVGGTVGYDEFVETILDPTHDEHVAMRRWYGGPYEPRGFDVNAVNRALRKLRL